MSGPLNAATTLTPRTAKVVLYQGDDQARINELADKAKRAKEADDSTPRSLDEIPAWQTAAEEHDEFVAEAEQRAVTVVLKALGRKQWRSLVAEHPARTDHEGDKTVGVNEETFQEPLVVASLIEPTFNTPADRDAFLDSLSDYQFEILYLNAFALNRALGEVPKAGLLSRLSQS